LLPSLIGAESAYDAHARIRVGVMGLRQLNYLAALHIAAITFWI